MNTYRGTHSPLKRVLIIKLRYIGDTLSIAPVVDNLKEQAPKAEVDVMVNKGTEEILTYNPSIRKLWIYDRGMAKSSIPSSLSYHKDLIGRLRSERYDTVIDFTLGDRAAFLSFMTGAPNRITYGKASRLSRILMNLIINSDPFKYHIVDYQLQSLRFLGLTPPFRRQIRIHIPELLDSKLDDILSASNFAPDSLHTLIHPGARGRLRQWRPERFAEIAGRLRSEFNMGIILVGGPGDTHLVETVEEYMGFPPSFESTSMTLLEMAALLKRCQLFIGNDSAPAHIAAAVHCPTLTLFGPTFPHMWRPVSPAGEVVFKNVPCRGCRQETCVRPYQTCMDLIGVDEVWEKAKRLLSRENP